MSLYKLWAHTGAEWVGLEVTLFSLAATLRHDTLGESELSSTYGSVLNYLPVICHSEYIPFLICSFHLTILLIRIICCQLALKCS
jgi:hypothetical protein